MNKFVTIIIPSYRSKKLILSHLADLSKNYKIIIIENSCDKILKAFIKKKYPNVKVYLKKNIGFGNAVNFAAKKIKTKYFISMNPDVTIYKDTINKLIIAANFIKKFGVISPVLKKIKNKKKNEFKKKFFLEKKNINSPLMFFNTKTFNKIKGFDKNIFLYFEENDYFTKCNLFNLKLYLISNSYCHHTNQKKNNDALNLHSTSFENIKEKNSTFFVGGWHGHWSKFYYLKKYNGFFRALLICLPHIFLITLQMILYIFFFNLTKAKSKYYKIEGFVCSIIGLPAFKRSIYDKKNIY